MATHFFVDYDLRKRKDYPELISELKRLGGLRFLKSSWSLKLDGCTCESLREHLTQFIDSDDGLMVSEVHNWAGRHLDASPNDH